MRHIVFVLSLAVMLAVIITATTIMETPIPAVAVSTPVSSSACANSQDKSYVSGINSQNPKTGPQGGDTGSNFGEGDTCLVSAPIQGI